MEDGRRLPRWINGYVAVVALLVLLPILVIVPVSFSATSSLALPTEGLSLRWYQSVFVDALLLTPITFPAVVFGGALLMVLAPIGLVRTIPGLVAAHALTTLPFVVR